MTTASPTGTIISIIALVITVMVAFVAPLVTWTVAQRQIAATAQETWMRELRQQAAELLRVDLAIRSYNRELARGQLDLEALTADRRELVKLREAFFLSYSTVGLLIAERGEPQRYAVFLEVMVRLFVAMERGASEAEIDPLRQEFTQAVTDILQSERAAIEADPGVWSALRGSVPGLARLLGGRGPGSVGAP